ncbi:MAG: helix-turn-helix transcriptional regulator [Dehalococcoidales bacterium]|nr:helix-turn-helix transcriptional regulator [Dehalococcoidales bacterium]
MTNKKDMEGISLEASFGQVLRVLRQQKGLSQEELGFESGYHRTYVSLLERGLKSPSLQTIFNISKALTIETSDLIKKVEIKNREFLRNRNASRS